VPDFYSSGAKVATEYTKERKKDLFISFYIYKYFSYVLPTTPFMEALVKLTQQNAKFAYGQFDEFLIATGNVFMSSEKCTTISVE